MTRNKRTLRLDPAHKKFLGVCAGVADFLEVEPWTVRLVFLGCCIFGGWMLVPLYFAVWFLLDDAAGGMRASLTDNLAVKHFRTVDYRKKVYRNTREAKWLGVCAGIADYLEVSAFPVRVVFVLLLLSTGGLPLLFYLAAWLVLDVRPGHLYGKSGRAAAPAGTDEATLHAGARAGLQHAERGRRSQGASEEEFHSRRREIKYCARKLASLQERLTRMEAYVTSSRFKLHREFRNIS